MKKNTIYVRCFGKLSIYVGNDEVTLLMNSLKARELIAFLIIYRGNVVKKATVCEALWENKPEYYSQDSLYKLIKKVNQMPIPFHLEYKRGMIRLGVDNIDSDIFQFEDIILHEKEIHRLETAVDLYSGTLYEQEDFNWIMEKDGYYDKLYLRAVSKLVEHYKKEGNTSKLSYYEHLQKFF